MKVVIWFALAVILVIVIGANEGFFMYANDGGLEAMSVVGMSCFALAVIAVNTFFVVCVVNLIKFYRSL